MKLFPSKILVKLRMCHSYSWNNQGGEVLIQPVKPWHRRPTGLRIPGHYGKFSWCLSRTWKSHLLTGVPLSASLSVPVIQQHLMCSRVAWDPFIILPQSVCNPPSFNPLDLSNLRSICTSFLTASKLIQGIPWYQGSIHPASFQSFSIASLGSCRYHSRSSPLLLPTGVNT